MTPKIQIIYNLGIAETSQRHLILSNVIIKHVSATTDMSTTVKGLLAVHNSAVYRWIPREPSFLMSEPTPSNGVHDETACNLAASLQ
jgi:hypothetical protein